MLKYPYPAFLVPGDAHAWPSLPSAFITGDGPGSIIQHSGGTVSWLSSILGGDSNATEPFIDSFCRPNFNGTWASITNELGAFTPCFIDIVVLGTACLCLLLFAAIRFHILQNTPPAARLSTASYVLQVISSFLALLAAIVPLMQLSARVSLSTFESGDSLPLSEVISLLICAAGWGLTSLVLFKERKGYVPHGAWLLRGAILYAVVGQLAKLRFVILLQDNFDTFFVRLFFFYTGVQVLLALLSFFYHAEAGSFPLPPPASSASTSEASQLVSSDSDGVGTPGADGYSALASAPADQQVCPENRVGWFSALTFSWMSGLMSTGYKRPLDESDVWQLDFPDRSATIFAKFDRKWKEEKEKRSPSLIRALAVFGPRFLYGGFWKLGNDASQFVGPLMLSRLLQSMQNDEPSWHGYIYALVIFVGQVAGVISESIYFQNVMRVGFHIRQALVAAVFSKALRLDHSSRQKFPSGRITNMMTNDSESLQMICQQLHNLWSAPLRITICMYLLYLQLDVASLAGFVFLLLTIPTQAFIVNIVQKLVKAALQTADKRVSLMNEILSSMDIVKCYVWEDSFKTKVNKIRGEEMSQIGKSQYIMAVNFFLLNVVPVLVTVVSFGTYTLLFGNAQLTPAKAFTSISLFAVLRFPLIMFPSLITQVVNVRVSLTRLQEMLLAEELEVDTSRDAPSPGKPAVEVEGASFSWSSPGTPGEELKATLTDITLEVKQGSLVAIIGATGQGKSSLLSALLGEMPVLSGDKPPIIRGSVAYVPQVSWIFNATVRDNILFGLPFDSERYTNAVKVSALERDFDLLPGGDLTEIGERGVNVSGGQKQRISIARAVYANADVYFFDDPLSALDAHVAKEVFETCVRSALQGRTRVLVTNQLHFLPGVDQVVLVENGQIVEQGTYQELLQTGPKFKLLLEQAGSLESAGDEQEEEDEKAKTHISGGVLKEDGKLANGEGGEKGGDGKGKKEKKEGTKLVSKEERETGVVSLAVVWRYVSAMGGWPALAVVMGLYFISEVARLASSTWISIWSGSSSGDSRYFPNRTANFFLAVYCTICLVQVLLTLTNQFWQVFCSQKAARRLHDAMLNSILRAPMAFFNSNPVGRLINRFTKDTADIDRNLAQYTSLCLGAVFQLISTFAVIGFLNTVALWAIIPLLAAFYIVYLYFQSTAREVKRLDSITRSPVYSQFAEALNGLSTIRAYRAQDRVAQANSRAMDRNVRFTLVNMSANRWLGIRLEFLGGLMIFATAVFAVMDVQRAGNQAALAPVMGLIISYALSITAIMTMVLRLASIAENSFNAVERVGSYADVQGEAPAVIPDHRPPPNWPTSGDVMFENVVMRYRPDLPPVLKGLSAHVKGGEKVGVVGRTGAGKSSLFNTLFRLTEVDSGKISIDGEDLRLFGLSDVRRALMIIPQTPVLFTGTIRFNLDPFAEHSDADIWESLQRAHLRDVVQRLPLGLESEVHEGGDNFSVGQRQLLSLSRALLRHAKILVLDEATASVDVGTDALIQQTIRSEFKECTMLIIAHRLNTIIDSDRILVMDAGQAVEYDTPSNLVLHEASVFSGMVRSTGAQNAKFLRNVALGEASISDEISSAAAKQEKRMQKEAAKWRWATAAQWAFAMTLTSSQNDLQAVCAEVEGRSQSRCVLEEVRDATMTLYTVLSGQRAQEISTALQERNVSGERWWSALTRVVQGLSLMSQQVQNQLDAAGNLRNEGQGGSWDALALTGQEHLGGS